MKKEIKKIKKKKQQQQKKKKNPSSPLQKSRCKFACWTLHLSNPEAAAQRGWPQIPQKVTRKHKLTFRRQPDMPYKSIKACCVFDHPAHTGAHTHTHTHRVQTHTVCRHLSIANLLVVVYWMLVVSTSPRQMYQGY